MSSEIIVALIGLGGSALGSVVGILASSRLTQYRLRELEKKVDAHNNLIARTYKLEERTAVIEEDLRVAGLRLRELEKGVAVHG